MNPTITLTEDGDESFLKAAIGTLENAKVYVGIPEAETNRTSTGSGPVTNAGLLFIHTNGSPLRHITARPVNEPSNEANHASLEEGLHAVAGFVLDGNNGNAERMLKRVGTLASNNAKKWFTDPRNGWRQNSPETIRRKLSKLTGKRRRKALKILNSVNENRPLVGTTALDGTNTPLIDTGQMRRAITHVEEFNAVQNTSRKTEKKSQQNGKVTTVENSASQTSKATSEAETSGEVAEIEEIGEVAEMLEAVEGIAEIALLF